jgi:hypothetical protein
LGLRKGRSDALKTEFARDSLLEETGFEPVWGFSCQVVVFGFWPVLCSERERPFFVPSPAMLNTRNYAANQPARLA